MPWIGQGLWEEGYCCARFSFLLQRFHLCRQRKQQRPFCWSKIPGLPILWGESGHVVQQGLMVELMLELFQRIGQPLRMELYPWKRCIYMVRNRKADALMLTVKTVEREQFAYFPTPFFVNKIQFFHKRDSPFSWNDFSDLKGLTIGIVDGAKYSQEFQDAIVRHGLNVELVSSIEINLKKLQAGRIDITPVLDVVAASIIASEEGFVGEFAVAEKPLKVTPMQMAIGRSSRLMEYRDAINAAILEMKSDGTVTSVYAKYVPQLSGP